MSKILCYLSLFCLFSTKNIAQEDDLSKMIGVEIIYLSSEAKTEKVGIKVGDVVLSYAGFPTSQEKYLFGIDQFLVQLEKQWIQEGKTLTFWKKHEKQIRKRARGVFVQPIEFSKEEKPLYEIVIKRKNAKKENQWERLKFKIEAGQYYIPREIKEPKRQEAYQLFLKGVQHFEMKNLAEALPFFIQAIQIFESIYDDSNVTANLDWAGDICRLQGKLELALKYYQKSNKICQKLRDQSRIANSLNKIGGIQDKRGHPEEALNYFLSALQLYQEIGDIQNVATCLNNIAAIYENFGEFEKALTYYLQSLTIIEKTENNKHLAVSLNNIGDFYKRRGEFKKALEFHHRSLKLKEKFKDPIEMATSLHNIGLVYSNQGKLEKALHYYKIALNLVTPLKQPQYIATSLNSIGIIYFQQGKHKLALKHFEKALKLHKQIGNPSSIANSLNTIASLYSEQGKLEKALSYHLRSLTLREKLNNPSAISNSLNNIGLLYLRLGKSEKAIDYCSQALELREEFGSPLEIANSLSNLGFFYSNQKNLEKALTYYQRALKLSEETGFPEGIATTLHNIAGIYLDQEKPKVALKYYQEALKLKKQIGIPLDISTTLGNIGFLYNEEGKFELAIKYFQEALKILEEIESAQNAIVYLNNIGGVYQTLGKMELAIASRLKAVEKIKSIANKAGSGRNEYFKEHLHEFAHTIERAYSTHPIEAFQTLQYCKAFGFITTLSELALPLEEIVDKKLIQEKESLISQTSALYKQINEYSSNKNVSPETRLQKKKQLHSLEIQLQEIIQKIRSGNQAYAQIDYPKPATLEEIRESLTNEELFLEFFCAPKEHGFPGYTYCFLIGKKSFKVIRLEETEKLNEFVEFFRSVLWESQDEQNPETYQETAFELYQILIEPVFKQSDLSQIKHLIIAPDGLLNLLPFEALCLSKEKATNYLECDFLIDHYQVSYTLSATRYKHISELHQKTQQQEEMTFFGIGNPLFGASKKRKIEFNTRAGLSFLPGTKEELESIAKLFPQKNQLILLGTQAIEPNIFLADLSKYKILHFATHGLINTKKPMYSSLALTQLTPKQQKLFEIPLQKKGLEPISCSDGFLQVRDIFRLYQKISAELIVLSACETANGKIERGDGIVGLTRAFQFAGARSGVSVVVSLWSVADQSTSQLMQHFYQRLLQDNPKTLFGKRLAALHFAKQALRHSEKYSAPYYWAPFILRGMK